MTRGKGIALVVKQLPDEHRNMLERQPESVHPTRHQYHSWSRWIDWAKEPDPEGWWYGWCPLGDPGKQRSMSAQFSFRMGSIRCAHESPCHEGKRAMSLMNLNQRISDNATAK